MAIALLVGRDADETKLFDWFIQNLSRELLALDNTLDIRIWPDCGDAADIDLALVWKHPFGALKTFPRLKCIASLAAGVDHVLEDPSLPKETPLIRLIDPHMANDITQFLLACVLHHVRRLSHWEDCQQKKLWLKKPPFNFSDKTIGIMGLGHLGKKAAETFLQIGLQVIGWSNSHKNIPGLKDFVGETEFSSFLSQTDILICILPLTPQTENILNRDTFSQLKPNACLINVGRGGHLVEEDLIDSLDAGKLDIAYLDVFRKEPLPTEHPFWMHPKIRVTPHIASVTHPATAAKQLLSAYHKLLKGEVVANRVDLTRGY